MVGVDDGRREFLKLLGLGAGGLAVTLSSVPGFLTEVLKMFNSDDVLSLEDIEVRETDPVNPEVGQFWVRKDVQKEGEN